LGIGQIAPTGALIAGLPPSAYHWRPLDDVPFADRLYPDDGIIPEREDERAYATRVSSSPTVSILNIGMDRTSSGAAKLFA
jgi:hypothetical protein